ncbi:hypothetical protein JL721_3209 [Aureococcus anophagefferens]|nr:hypothetical protein JL721_3209 [Aureococcus anophagefferens]
MLSALGRCHTLDRRADGYCRGEGCGSFQVTTGAGSARVDGIAVQQDGPSASLTAPNGTSQQRLLVAISWASARAVALEAHGTGTALGDPIEIGAAARALRATGGTARCSSLKSNAGHLEAAAAAAGLAALVTVSTSIVPPNAQLRRLNAHVGSLVSGEDSRAELPSEATARRASAGRLSSFGFSGTIAHGLYVPGSTACDLVDPSVRAASAAFEIAKRPQRGPVRATTAAPPRRLFAGRFARPARYARRFEAAPRGALSRLCFGLLDARPGPPAPGAASSSGSRCVPRSRRRPRRRRRSRRRRWPRRGARDAAVACVRRAAAGGDAADAATLDDLGVDSLGAVELRNAVARATGVELSGATVLSNPTVGALVAAVVAAGAAANSEANAAARPSGEAATRALQRATPPAVAPCRKIPRVFGFVLSTPRAGSSLTQLCLNAHSRLFAPQELYLLAFADLRERRAALRDYALLLAGLGGAVGDLRRGDGRGLAAFWERGGAATAAIYAALAEWAAPRCAAHGREGRASAADVEREWVTYVEAALAFSRRRADALRVTYEQLVTAPAATLRRVAEDLFGLAYEPATAAPYGSAAVAQFAPASGVAVVDDTLLRRRRVEPALADKWTTVDIVLGGRARRLAWQLGYAVRDAAAASARAARRR